MYTLWEHIKRYYAYLKRWKSRSWKRMKGETEEEYTIRINGYYEELKPPDDEEGYAQWLSDFFFQQAVEDAIFCIVAIVILGLIIGLLISKETICWIIAMVILGLIVVTFIAALI